MFIVGKVLWTGIWDIKVQFLVLPQNFCVTLGKVNLSNLSLPWSGGLGGQLTNDTFWYCGDGSYRSTYVCDPKVEATDQFTGTVPWWGYGLRWPLGSQVISEGKAKLLEVWLSRVVDAPRRSYMKYEIRYSGHVSFSRYPQERDLLWSSVFSSQSALKKR